MSNIDRMKNVLTKVTGNTPDALASTTRVLDIPGMTSLVFIRFIVALEKEFSVRFDTRAILELSTVGDIIKKIETGK